MVKKSLLLSLDEKRKLIDDSAEITLREQYMLLGLSISSDYYKASPISAEDERIMELLDEHYLQYPCEGKIKRAQWLSKEVDYPVTYGGHGIRNVSDIWLSLMCRI